MTQVAIIGSTGSIGKSSLAVIDANPDKYKVFALCANQDWETLFSQVKDYRPKYAVLANSSAAEKLKEAISVSGFDTEVLSGSQAIESIAREPEINSVIAAIVGSAGLPSTMAAVRAGKKVLLANKETLVCGGKLFMEAVASNGATLLPVDSEHNAIFQCLENKPGRSLEDVKKIYLTGSGGPFRGKKIGELASVTPDQACAHPNWSMGRKISVDSATMMNKGLELIEACWMFDTRAELIDIVIHPQSIIHSMVHYVDGSVIAQMGSPDMRTPIAHALAWPERVESNASAFDLFQSEFTFEQPDYENYPCLKLALDAAENISKMPLVLNAANEIAVDAFLQSKIGYLDIAQVVQEMLAQNNYSEPRSIEEVIDQDKSVRAKTHEYIEGVLV